MKEIPIAVLTIRDADALTPQGRLTIAGWLSKQAESLLAEGDNYSRLFRARHYSAGWMKKKPKKKRRK